MDLVIEDPQQIYEITKALSVPTRIQILKIISTQPASVLELTNILKMSKGNVSSHVSQLESLGLIEVEYKNGIKGIKKIIKPKYNRIIIIFKDPQQL
ncbi:transcriptional regulator [Sulfolobus sp. A20]|uniref:ArsR/SmtB family transcription factor n=1 Tax=Sulfolobaceae TaxID=118883 RepID=UPI0008461DC8|nr:MULTISPECIES: winged helix-turn-helix domain-containing protein [unclassified Sulfolobus]TRM77791.1 ArsR family transcriptional regulator [Sulfolobus sp. A20-N-F8]TRM80040.1 ArsR family transcriptional regulator [Sulfolobus sp. D5]TRM81907.1 ArsR family transcriptional regulator [Sulfolobus sp. A20-N-F6]TRM84210.1 ArsR family transcriptional regulator [Sulfolobus sp. F3]TRM87501.1 ArsR family transcriptional regulator [Sulfolobus sp. E3]TRM87542.1 ArsR family transcriptional regulator [Sul